MRFTIDIPPPGAAALDEERQRISKVIDRIRLRDHIITFLVIVTTSILLFFTVYWLTDNIRLAGIAASVFPGVGAVLALTGLITAVGFRSAARQMLELKHHLIALSPISDGSRADVSRLTETYPAVREYQEKVEKLGRDLVNGELAMFWEWDTSTLAKQDRRRDFVDKARESINT